MSNVNDRIRGTLLGLAWGDVLGSPVEGWRTQQIRAIFGDYKDYPSEYPIALLQLLGKKVLRRLRPLGLHSDDTQQAMALINVCLAGWSPEVWAGWLVHGQKQKAWRGFGRNFKAAVAKMSKGKPPQKAGTPSGGIGAVMRIAPLAALYRDDPPLLAKVVMESSLCTHGDIRAGALAFAVAHTAAAFIAGQEVETIKAELPGAVAAVEKEWLDNHADWTIGRSAGSLISRSLEAFFAEKLSDPGKMRLAISKLARPHLAKRHTKAHPNQGFVLLGGLHGLAMALLDDENANAILSDIVLQGYDTDTIAAITGGLLGARLGTDWIPLDRFRDRERLLIHADALVDRKMAPEDLDSFVQRELEWTKEEAKYQESLGKMGK